MNWPWWLILVILGVEGWPVTLALDVVLLLLAALTRGCIRWAAIAAALPCFVLVAVAAWRGIDAWQRGRDTAAYEARVDQVLDRNEVVDSLALPAGTALRWQDVEHTRLGTAFPPELAALFGVRVSWLRRAADGTGWDLNLTEPGRSTAGRARRSAWRCPSPGGSGRAGLLPGGGGTVGRYLLAPWLT